MAVEESALGQLEGLGTFGPPCSTEVQGAVSYGFYGIIRALGFLHGTCKSAHGLLSNQSVYVTPSGEWKLFHFPLLTFVPPHPSFELYESHLCPEDYRSPERLEKRYNSMIPNRYGVHAMDSYGLGVLMEAVYTRPDVDREGSLPQKLVKAVHRMRSSTPAQRPRSQVLLKCPVFNNPLVQSQITLDDLAVQSSEEKTHYYRSVPEKMANGSLPMSVAKNKLLPKLLLSLNCVSSAAAMAQENTRREVLSVLPPLFHISSSLADVEYEKWIVPTLPPLFQVADRAIRASLLSSLHVIVPRIEKNNSKTVNLIFDAICSGFTDSSSQLRELTLKCMLYLVPVVSPASLEKLVRYLIRLQGDPDASIRTNTIIFVGKIASTLSDNMRQKLILPAFTRATSDTFTPCRLAALKSVLSCQQYFDHVSLATKVLPVVVPHLMDATADVRQEALVATRTFVGVLEQRGKEMEREDQETLDVVNGGNATALATDAAPESGSSYSWGITSWMSKTSLGEGNTPPPPTPGPATVPTPVTFPLLPKSDAITTDEDDGWGDDEDLGDLGGDDISTPTWASKSGGLSGLHNNTAAVDDGDNFFSSFEKDSSGNGPASTSSNFPVRESARPLSISGSRGKTKLVVPTTKKNVVGGRLVVSKTKNLSIAGTDKDNKLKPQIVKLAVSPTKDGAPDGWDDF